ncbi:UPF0764 protein C16orf89-like [Sycon ciliatum]|uniref:UPF0764 protein C16orf89-like n=1 Tax=Sycon ciliatum TaxID=27933 RepID=UPI0020A9A432|eukprot:scpid25679/ scgid33472/ UPF0764 protein C16orf89 homolog
MITRTSSSSRRCRIVCGRCSRNQRMRQSLLVSTLLILLTMLLLKVRAQPGATAAGSAKTAASNDRLSKLNEYMTAAGRAVNFFVRHSHRITLDGVYALRIAQVHFRAMESFLKKMDRPPLPQEELRSFVSLADNVDNLVTVGVQSNRHSKSPKMRDYFRRMGYVLEAPMASFSLSHIPNMLLSTPVLDRVEKPDFTEESSDLCMSEIIGTGPTQRRCTLSPDCVHFMLEPRGARTKGYVLTHQLLFAQLSLSLGCEEVYEKALRVLAKEHPSDVKTATSMRHLFSVGCANVYLEMNKTVSDSEASKEPIDSIAQDIFLEQGTICTYYGYPAMVPDAWLAKALQFQTGLGCLDDGRRIAANAGEDLVKYDVDQEVSADERAEWSKRHAREISEFTMSRSRATGRKLMYDRQMPDGCSQHSTGLFVSYLAGKMRYMTELLAHRHRHDLSKSGWLKDYETRTKNQEAGSLFAGGVGRVKSAAGYLSGGLERLLAALKESYYT